MVRYKLARTEGAETVTLEQQKHLSKLTFKFALLIARKYTRGAAEHGGNLWDLSAEQLLDEAIAECIDQFTYLMTLKEKLSELR